jgi:LmbE family N-acetylglucosaminyl deacetylase
MKSAASKKPASAAPRKLTAKIEAEQISREAAAVDPVEKSGRQKFTEFLRSRTATLLFVWGSLAILFTSVSFWSVLGARIQQGNADQLIDAFLFESATTFQGAIFPSAHSFLIKWPVFALMQLFGNKEDVFVIATLLMSMATVATIVWLFYKIEKRPRVFGLLCLCLASVLLLVPAQPHPGALLPTNFAMTTTRNLEYVLFIIILYHAVRLKRAELTKVKPWLLMIGFGLLVASDKLFAVLAIGSGILAAFWYLLQQARRRSLGLTGNPGLVHSSRWLLITALGVVWSMIIIWVINRAQLTNIGEKGDVASPYPLIQSTEQFIIASAYAVMGFLTNFGANPVHATVILRDLPRDLLESLGHFWAIPYAVNLVLLLIGLYAVVRIMRRHTGDLWSRISLILVGSTLTAAAVYVLTDHYYPVDSRYLTIALFAVAVAAATYFRSRTVSLKYGLLLALVVSMALPIGAQVAWSEYRASQGATEDRTRMTTRVSEEMDRHNVDRLVGNYWDVTPVKSEAEKEVTISPVDNCTNPRPVLTSKAWYENQQNRSSAYLVVRDGSPEAGPDHTRAGNQTTYGGCTLQKLIGNYGKPSQRVVIDPATVKGEEPDVLLLLYPDGIVQKASAQTAKTQQKPAAPDKKEFIALSDRAVCSRGTSLQVVAHEDDDLLFMNPDLIRGIKEGRCQRTVFLTAGDAGESELYWGGREKGAKAAYAQMYEASNVWRDERQLLAGRDVLVSYLIERPEISLVFLRLPDGNIHGNGFASREHASLHGILTGRIQTIEAVDKSAHYTKQDLVGAILSVMSADKPDQIRTLGSHDHLDGDHSDHHAAGDLTDEAAKTYLESHAIIRYLGYPSNSHDVNLNADDITIKQAAFLAYASFDGAVCQSSYECMQTLSYGGYLQRQYQHIPPAAAAPEAAPAAEPAPAPAPNIPSDPGQRDAHPSHEPSDRRAPGT